MFHKHHRRHKIGGLIVVLLNCSISHSLPNYPSCCICQDNCVSRITIPDTIIVLPEGIGIPSASCADIQQAAQMDLLFPEAYCNILWSQIGETLQRECGCQNFLAAEQQREENPPCFLCGGGGTSVISRPDAVVALPELASVLGFTEASCESIRCMAEDLRQFPADVCTQLDRNDLRVACGCANIFIPTVAAVEYASVVDLPTVASGDVVLAYAEEDVVALSSMEETEPPLTFVPEKSSDQEVAEDSATENPICYVCFDNGTSTVTKPESIVALPPETLALTGGLTEVSCAMVESVAELLRLVPAELCPLLDRNDLRLACGCANASQTTAPQLELPTPPTTITSNPPVPSVPTNPPVIVVVPAPVPISNPESFPLPTPILAPVAQPAPIQVVVPTPLLIPIPLPIPTPVVVPAYIPVDVQVPLPISAPIPIPTPVTLDTPVFIPVPTTTVPPPSVPLVPVTLPAPTPRAVPVPTTVALPVPTASNSTPAAPTAQATEAIPASVPAPAPASVPVSVPISVPVAPILDEPAVTADASSTTSPAGVVDSQPTASATTAGPTLLLKNVEITAFPTLDDGTVGLSTSKQKGSPCYLCFDDGFSTITNPDAIAPQLESPLFPKGLLCEEIRVLAEDDQLLSSAYCFIMDNPELRQVCGCENALLPPASTPTRSKPSISLPPGMTLPPTAAPPMDSTSAAAPRSSTIKGVWMSLGIVVLLLYSTIVI